MHNSNIIGIDLAKQVIQVCLISKHGELISNKATRTVSQVSPFNLEISVGHD